MSKRGGRPPPSLHSGWTSDGEPSVSLPSHLAGSSQPGVVSPPSCCRLLQRAAGRGQQRWRGRRRQVVGLSNAMAERVGSAACGRQT
jgi:hypothetical protein